MFVEEELGIFPHFLVWAVLEWMLIISLYLDGFFTFISNKFADTFELDPPCVLCTRVDHALCGKNPNLYYNESICDSHKKDISSLAYCHVHRKLSDIRTMCESCLLSFAIEKDSDSDTNNADDHKPEVKPKKKVKDGNKNDGIIDPNMCSCCGACLKPKQPSKEFSKSLSSLRTSYIFPTCSPRASSSPRAYSSLAPTSSPRASSSLLPTSSPRAFSSLFPSSLPRAFSSLAPMCSPRAFSSQTRFTELKFVSDDMPEDEYGSNTITKHSEEVNEDASKTSNYMKGNKFFGIPLTEPVASSPRWRVKPPKNAPLEKVDLVLETIEEQSANEYSTIQQLKKQVNDNRKTLVTLYMELDEERSAATVAANNAMAMITRLQAEKAGVHMEALQYQRMMDEQAEYDEEAIQILKDLLLKKEEDVRVLEAELDAYRERFGEIKKPDNDEYYDDLQPRSLWSCGDKSESGSIMEDHINVERSQLFGMLKDIENHINSSSRQDHHQENNKGDGDNTPLRREVNQLREKLAAIEAESGFLKHTAMALEKGDEGTKLLTEIAEHLRKLQRHINCAAITFATLYDDVKFNISDSKTPAPSRSLSYPALTTTPARRLRHHDHPEPSPGRDIHSKADDAIQNFILEAPWFKCCKRLCAYISCSALREVDTSKVLQNVLNKPKDGETDTTKILYVPRVEDKNCHMRMLNISRMDDLIANSMNILEPVPVDADGNDREDVMLADEPVDLLLLPGLAFDKTGRRLGCVALSHSVQIIEDGVIPLTPSDVFIDALVSPSGFIPITSAAQEINP
ncbi:hypothetical protein L1987_10037 [Smallanthus sonchifolius]|uniref:Uncharacterized protein n=1 Tax=Smallanthus sonchifolius TaxID=185202 RepID=A0ACB9JR06_9ASTR|nr:hypothetical protein L1987_10037 [Smallanthus sonchifolius]